MGSNKRRRNDRGLGANGIPITPAKPKASLPPAEQRESTGTNLETRESSFPTVVNTSVAPEIQPPVVTPSPIPDIAAVHPAAKVQIIQQVTSIDGDGNERSKQNLVATVPATKLCSASSRFDALVRGMPNFGSRTVFNFVILERDATAHTIKEFVQWLNGVNAPFPKSYFGSKHLPTKDASNNDYDTVQIAAMYKLVKWLGLKRPFRAERLVNKLWTTFKDPSQVVDAEEVIAVWQAMTGDDGKLRKQVIWQTVEYIEYMNEHDGNDMAFLSFKTAFEASGDQSLIDAFNERGKASAEHHRRKAEQEQKRKESAKLRRQAKVWEKEQKEQKKREDEAAQNVKNRRGVGVISADDVKDIDLPALRGRP